MCLSHPDPFSSPACSCCSDLVSLINSFVKGTAFNPFNCELGINISLLQKVNWGVDRPGYLLKVPRIGGFNNYATQFCCMFEIHIKKKKHKWSSKPTIIVIVIIKTMLKYKNSVIWATFIILIIWTELIITGAHAYTFGCEYNCHSIPFVFFPALSE